MYKLNVSKEFIHTSLQAFPQQESRRKCESLIMTSLAVVRAVIFQLTFFDIYSCSGMNV